MSEILEHKLNQVEIKQTRSQIKPIRFKDEAINKVRKENYVFGNRGNHFNAVKEGKYPNDAFKLYNENKKRMAQLNELNGKFKSEDHKNEFMRLNSIALKEAEKKVMEKAKNTPTLGQFKNYGSMLSHRGLEIRRAMDIDRLKLDSSWSGSRSVYFGSRRNPYEPGAGVDDGSVEVDISRSNSSNDLNSMPRFSSKVQEEIWKLKNKK